MSYGVLIIEDEVILAKKIAKYLNRNGFETRVVPDGVEGLATLQSFHPDAVLLDFNLPGDLNGLDVLERIKAHDPTIKVIMITGHGNVRLAVDAMKAGAYDYLSKPIVLGELNILLNRAIGQNQKEGQLTYFRDKQAERGDIDQIVGKSPAIQAVKEQIGRIVNAGRQLAGGPPPAVLITGETGTGKELVARALHFEGIRAKEPFIELNVATLPPHIVDSELFGYEKGAFTDARNRKLGLVEAANGGTLFLDEIGELDLSIQAKMLKLLEDRNIRRLGSVRSHNVDIQIITATNRNLREMVTASTFRDDLFFRLNTFTINVPPLRERGDDIILLANHFAASFGKKYNKTGLVVAKEAGARMMHYNWPGNVRELSNIIEQAVLLCDGEQISNDLLPIPQNDAQQSPQPQPAAVAEQQQPEPPAATATLVEVEKDLITRTLSEVDGNVSKAARILGISRDQMRYRIEKYRLSPKS